MANVEAKRVTRTGPGEPLTIEPAPATCDNCRRPFAEHCKAHLVPCCPGKCTGGAARVARMG